MNDARSEHKNAAKLAISSGVPKRSIGTSARILLRVPSRSCTETAFPTPTGKEYVPGRDAIDADLVARDLPCEVLAVIQQSRFRGAVGKRGSGRFHAGDRRDEHDAPAVSL